jgi:hypothetical protein
MFIGSMQTGQMGMSTGYSPFQTQSCGALMNVSNGLMGSSQGCGYGNQSANCMSAYGAASQYMSTGCNPCYQPMPSFLQPMQSNSLPNGYGTCANESLNGNFGQYQSQYGCSYPSPGYGSMAAAPSANYTPQCFCNSSCMGQQASGYGSFGPGNYGLGTFSSASAQANAQFGATQFGNTEMSLQNAALNGGGSLGNGYSSSIQAGIAGYAAEDQAILSQMVAQSRDPLGGIMNNTMPYTQNSAITNNTYPATASIAAKPAMSEPSWGATTSSTLNQQNATPGAGEAAGAASLFGEHVYTGPGSQNNFTPGQFG